MNLRAVKYDSLMLLTAAIWGFAFVAQRAGMEYVGPFIFNGVRFGLGSLALVPIILIRNRIGADLSRPTSRAVTCGHMTAHPLLNGGILAGTPEKSER